jgi:hypothetical protein
LGRAASPAPCAVGQDAFALLAERLWQPLYLWFVPLWRGMRALMQGRLADCERLTGHSPRPNGEHICFDQLAFLSQLGLLPT